MTKQIILPIILSIILSACTTTQTPAPSTPSTPATSQSSATSTTSSSTSYTLSDVAKHNSATDCYLAIDNKVYDVSQFVSQHPGGEAILQGCGKDATALFKGMGKHQTKATQMLPQFEIGILK